MRQHYFAFVIPGWIESGEVEAEAVRCLTTLLQSGVQLESSTIPAIMEWAIATGDMELLGFLSASTRGKYHDVEGCLSLLKGDWDAAFVQLTPTVSTRVSKKTLSGLGRLPSLLMLLSAFSSAHELTPEKARQSIAAFQKKTSLHYESSFEVLDNGLAHCLLPGDAEALIRNLNETADSPLSKCFAGYLSVWLTGENDIQTGVTSLSIQATLAPPMVSTSWLLNHSC